MTDAEAPSPRVGASRRRSLAGWVVALLLLPFLLGNGFYVPGLLNTPIGDPEQGWADPRISGVWLGSGIGHPEPSDFRGTIWVFEPYDSKTWLVTWADFKDVGPPEAPPNQASAPSSNEAQPSPTQEPASAGEQGPKPGPRDVLRIVESLGNERARPRTIFVFKAWLTTLGGRRFLVVEPKVSPWSARGFRPGFWLVCRADLDGGRLLLSPLDVEREKVGEATTRAQKEAIIARHAADPKFIELAITLYPVPRAGYDAAAKALERAFAH